MTKERLRLELQECLLEISAEAKSEKSKKACRNLISTKQFQDASVIMIFLSLPHEVDTTEIVLHAWQMDKIVAAPKVSWQQKHMIPVRIDTLDTGFSTAVAGLRNPIKGLPVPEQEIDLVITPALGYDREGNRLGRGGSYYDRFFANEKLKAPRCGLAFAEQLIDSIPVTERDEPVDFLVTDEEIIYFNNNKRQGE
ncbi:MAG: 5-formyltetrahydrofolate cyclo-ligase [Planctomycetes bacterium]|nr:5-formyltetrahydrofolate cyclo-ligase [Planctomycetota bacterium]